MSVTSGMFTQVIFSSGSQGVAQLKKLRRAEGGVKIVGVFSVKNHDFTPKNHIFFNFRGGAPPGSAPDITHSYHQKK